MTCASFGIRDARSKFEACAGEINFA